MRRIVRDVYNGLDWLASGLVKLMSPEFNTKGPFLPTQTQVPRALNVDGTPMLTETVDMEGKPYGF